MTKTFYGVTSVEVPTTLSLRALREAERIGVAQGAQVTNKESGDSIRSVQMWRIPIDSMIGDKLKEYARSFVKAFGYDAEHIQDIQYLEYRKTDKYDWHMDIDSANDAAKRKISISWLLNDEYEGGDLEIQVHGESYRYKQQSQMIAFTSFLNHRVTPITKGCRKAIVAWINGGEWK